MSIDVHIYGVHVRDSMIHNTKCKLGLPDDYVHYDDRPNGGFMIYTAKKAWLAPIDDGVTHRVALADDVEVCCGFMDICKQIAETHPRHIISFFPYEFMSRNPEIERLDTPYFKAHILSGCGIMMPVEYIKPCFDFIREKFNDECPDDFAIQTWAQDAGIPILTTVPALLQHIGDESIANKGCFIRRTVYYDEYPEANWNSKKIMEYRHKEWFFSNKGKQRNEKGVLVDVTER